MDSGRLAKINGEQRERLQCALEEHKPLRAISFNMLFNLQCSEKELDEENRWAKRGPRLIEYLRSTNADLIGTQELQKNQLDQIEQAIGEKYASYGVGEDGGWMGDIGAIFYLKERLELLEGKTYFFSTTPEVVSSGPFKTTNTFTVCHFFDRESKREFVVINTHLAFGNIERRAWEAHLLCDFVSQIEPALPLIVMGDFNTFPYRPELELPFYDGDFIVNLIEGSTLKDARMLTLLGHYGALSTTNYSPEEKKTFRGFGVPGVILDHIFVNKEVGVLAHGIDPATVDGHFPSDHFPVIADLILPSE